MSLEQDFTRYPIGIYARGVRLALAFALPFALMNDCPATFLGAAWAAFAYAFWRVGLRRYQGTGS